MKFNQTLDEHSRFGIVDGQISLFLTEVYALAVAKILYLRCLFQYKKLVTETSQIGRMSEWNRLKKEVELCQVLELFALD